MLNEEIEHVVVGIDGSAAAAAALRWASYVAALTGASVHAVHAQHHPHTEVGPEENERLMTEQTDEWVRAAVDSGIAVDTKVVQGDPRTVVLEAADERSADLVVLGRTGSGGGPGFLHLGSVVEHAAHHTRQPLAVIPPDAASRIGKIVVGVDGSEASSAAVTWCARIAGVTGAEVVAVSFYEPIVEWTPSWSEGNWRRAVEREIERWVAPVAQAGITVEVVAKRGQHPADGLLATATEHSADLLIVGTRGVGGFIGLRSGGVAMKLLHGASMPLILVPPTDGD